MSFSEGVMSIQTAGPTSAPTRAEEIEIRPDARLRALVDANVTKLWMFVRRLGVREADVEDVLQEVILVTANRLADIAPGAERSFFFSTAYRAAAKWRRRVSHHREVYDDISDPVDPARRPDEALEHRQTLGLLEDVLEGMPIELRAVFVLYEIEEHTMAEISLLLNLASGTTASRLRRAREMFEEKVERLRARRGGLQ